MKRKRSEIVPYEKSPFKKRKLTIPRQLSLYYGRYAGKNAELKFFEDTQDVSNLATAGVIAYISLNRIPQGVTETTRVGRKCVIKRINLRGTVSLPSQTAIVNATNTYRVIVYLDKQANGDTATVTDILETADEKAFNNLSNSQRFTVLKDWYFQLSSTSSTSLTTFGTGPVQKILKFNKKCNIPIEFSGTTGVIGEVRSNNIGVLGICANVGSTAPVLDLTSRIRFSDS